MTIWGLYKGVRGKKTGGKHRAKYKKVQSCLSLVRSENSFEHYTRMTQKRLKAFVYQVYSLYLYMILLPLFLPIKIRNALWELITQGIPIRKCFI